MKKLYTPTQMAVGTYLGGPFAAIYFLKTNFDALGNKELSKITLVLGLIASAVVVALLPFLPDSTPNSLLPILFLVPVVLTAKNHQKTKVEIAESEDYIFQSSWKSFSLSILCMFAFLIVALAFMLILTGLGIEF